MFSSCVHPQMCRGVWVPAVQGTPGTGLNPLLGSVRTLGGGLCIRGESSVLKRKASEPLLGAPYCLSQTSVSRPPARPPTPAGHRGLAPHGLSKSSRWSSSSLNCPEDRWTHPSVSSPLPPTPPKCILVHRLLLKTTSKCEAVTAALSPLTLS